MCSWQKWPEVDLLDIRVGLKQHNKVWPNSKLSILRIWSHLKLQLSMSFCSTNWPQPTKWPADKRNSCQNKQLTLWTANRDNNTSTIVFPTMHFFSQCRSLKCCREHHYWIGGHSVWWEWLQRDVLHLQYGQCLFWSVPMDILNCIPNQ